MYTTIALVRAASGFSNVTNIPDATITQYIADADSVINSKVADVYQLPLSDTCDVVAMLSRHITVGLLYANEYGEESEGTDKGWKGRMDWAMGILDDIQKGKMKLYTSAGVELTRSSLKNMGFYPTATSSEPSAEDSTAPKFTMNKTF